MTTQDLIKGIDITGLVNITGSEVNQLVDVARLAADKGMVIVTTDSALNTPVVPDPNAAVIGITPLWWKRYIWLRLPFDNTGKIKVYTWNEFLVSDATYLKWYDLFTDMYANTTAIATAQADIITAQNTADAAEVLGSNIIAGFEPQVAGKYQILASNVVNLPTTYQDKIFANNVLVVNSANPATFIDTGWIFVNVVDYLTQVGEVNTGAHSVIGALLEIEVSTQLIGAGAASAEVDSYFYIGSSTVAPVVDISTVPYANAKIIRVSPNDILVTTNKQFIIQLVPGIPSTGFWYKWLSTGVNNTLKVTLRGFRRNVNFY